MHVHLINTDFETEINSAIIESLQMKKFWPLVIGLFIYFVQPAVAALQLTFSGLPEKVEGDAPFEISVNLLDAPKLKKYYLRAALFESGKTSYFGYTLNHLGNWHNQPGEHLNYLEITTNDQGSWSGQLKAKADLGSSYFKGGGEYQFKIGRYTEGGSLSWSDNEDALAVNYAAASTPAASPQPSTGNDSPQPNPTPAASPSPSSSPQPSKIYRIKEITLLKPSSRQEILGTASSRTQHSPQHTRGRPGKPDRQLVTLLILTGTGLLAAAAIIIVRLWRQS